MLELDNVQVSYGKSRIVNGVSFSLGEGERLAVLGRNGVGKTTLLKGIIGLLPLSDGMLRLDGNNISALPPHERSHLGLAYVPQGREILPHLTVLENLQLGCIDCRDKKLVEERTERMLEYFPALKSNLPRFGGLLSGGQQQQLAVARALMISPRILLLDEPTEGIQPNIVEELGCTLNRISLETKLAFILVEQNLDFAQRMTDHFVILQKGSVVCSGRTADLDRNAIKRYLSV
jgi:urea transport system ATP-binding protein